MTEYQGTTFCPNSLHWFGGGLWSSGSVWCLLLGGGGTAKGLLSPFPLEAVLLLLAAQGPQSILSRFGYVKSTNHLREHCVGLIISFYS